MQSELVHQEDKPNLAQFASYQTGYFPSQNSVVGSGFEDGVLNPAKSTPTEEVPTDIDEIELKEADYQLWHEEPPPPGQCQEANLDHSLAGTSVVVIDGPIKHTDLVLPSSDTSQPSTWLVDHLVHVDIMIE